MRRKHSMPALSTNAVQATSAADQLTSVERSQDNVVTPIRYTYDAAGNRTGEQSGGQVRSWGANAFNQLTTESSGGPMEVRGTVSTPSTVVVNGQAATMNGNQWVAKVTAGVGGFAQGARQEWHSDGPFWPAHRKLNQML